MQIAVISSHEMRSNENVEDSSFRDWNIRVEKRSELRIIQILRTIDIFWNVEMRAPR